MYVCIPAKNRLVVHDLLDFDLTYCRGDAKARVSSLPMDLLQLVLSSA